MSASVPFSGVLRALWILLSINIFTGCAALSQNVQSQDSRVAIDTSKTIIGKPVTDGSDPEHGWWQIGFHRQYLHDENIQWQYDAFIALKIFKPVIENEKNISLWRFHRRAIDDKSGHKFSFIFYAPRKVGESIYQQVSQSTLVKELLDQQKIKRLSFYDINSELRAGIGDTSDNSWPIELQNTWPYFIMGVSQTWLGLVEFYYNQLDSSELNGLDDQLDAFKQVNASIDKTWKNSGSHAFLHHLNALFGYQELYIVERRLMRF